MSAYKPVGYSSVSPYLIVHNVEAVIDFLVETLNAERLRIFHREDGSIMHAEAGIDDSVVMIGGALPEWPTTPCHIHIYVSDVDAVYSRALKSGGEVVQSPTVKAGETDKRGGVRGPSGNTWWFATDTGA